MREEHSMDKEKHNLGIKPKRRRGDGSMMENFLTVVEPILSAEEALLQFFTITNQPFDLIEHKAFKNLYQSIGTTTPISNPNTL